MSHTSVVAAGAKAGKPSGRATKSAATPPGVPAVARPKVAARKIARATNDDEYDEPTDKREPRKPVARAGGPRTRQPMRDSKRMEPANTDAPPRPAKANPKKLNQANDANTFRNSRRTPKAVPHERDVLPIEGARREGGPIDWQAA